MKPRHAGPGRVDERLRGGALLLGHTRVRDGDHRAAGELFVGVVVRRVASGVRVVAAVGMRRRDPGEPDGHRPERRQHRGRRGQRHESQPLGPGGGHRRGHRRHPPGGRGRQVLRADRLGTLERIDQREAPRARQRPRGDGRAVEQHTRRQHEPGAAPGGEGQRRPDGLEHGEGAEQQHERAFVAVAPGGGGMDERGDSGTECSDNDEVHTPKRTGRLAGRTATNRRHSKRRPTSRRNSMAFSGWSGASAPGV